MNRLSRQFLLLFFAFFFTGAKTQNNPKTSSSSNTEQPFFSYPKPIPQWAFENKHQVLHVMPKEKTSHCLKLKKQRYNLINLHFHYPSEHTVNGKFFPLEAHFVHENAKRELAVVSVLIQEGKKLNAWYEHLVSCLKQAIPFKKTKTNVHQSLNLEKLLPPGVKLVYRDKMQAFKKSRGITWLVAKQPVTLSKEQIHTIKTCYQNQAHMPSAKKAFKK